MVLEKDREHQLDQSCKNAAVLHTVKEEKHILNTEKRKTANWIGHILCSNHLLEHVIEGKTERTG
jgi:hypothetical protein